MLVELTREDLDALPEHELTDVMIRWFGAERFADAINRHLGRPPLSDEERELAAAELRRITSHAVPS
jgi:hypothetical protein